MSDYRAIGAVSASIQKLLTDKMVAAVPVTIAPPDVTVSEAPNERVNLFLYRVEENAALKNMDLPGRGSAGAYGRPPLALDLHYLITAYGPNEENQLNAHQILGDAMAVLHDHAVVLAPELSVRLRNEFENVKIYYEPLSLEELSKIWSSVTLPYRLSCSYRVTVVQIESRQPRTYPRPVGELPSQGPRVKVVTFRSAVLDEVAVIRAGDATRTERTAYARIGDTLVLKGSNFVDEGLRIFLGDVDATAQRTSFGPSRIEATVPDDAALQPGPMTVRLMNDVLVGDPPEARGGFASNVAVFMIVPSMSGFSADFTARTLEITGSRIFAADVQAMTIIGTAVVDGAAYTVKTPTRIVMPLPAALAEGSHPLRVRIDGAETFEPQTLVVPA